MAEEQPEKEKKVCRCKTHKVFISSRGRGKPEDQIDAMGEFVAGEWKLVYPEVSAA
jgi:hypothetical protein